MHVLLCDFLRHLEKEKKYSGNTLEAYGNDLTEYIDFLESINVKIEEAHVSDVREWIVNMSDERVGVGPQTVKRRISALRSFYKYLKIEGKVKRNPAAVLILPKTGKPLPKFFQEEEMDKVLDKVLVGEELTDRRDKLIIDLFYQTGVRVTELVSIKDSDVDVGRGLIDVLGKRRKERQIPIGIGMRKEIMDYKVKRNEEVGSCSYLFVNKSGGQLNRRTVYGIVKKYMSMVTTQKKRSPHVLRHTFASTMLNNGADIYAVKALLGHSTLAATEVYTHTSFAGLQRTYKKAHPREQI